MTPTEIWPVIHLDSTPAAVANARLAQEAGAHGVFLIHMQGHDDLIDVAYWAIRGQVPGLAVGANFLSLDADEGMARAIALGMDASWSDNPGISSRGASDLARRVSQNRPPNHLHFAGVAFKYQAAERDPGRAASEAIALGLIPTTSGDATGHAPTVDKLRQIRDAIGSEVPLACASGLTPDNLPELAPLLTHALVATGISQDFHTLCEAKLRAMLRVARGE